MLWVIWYVRNEALFQRHVCNVNSALSHFSGGNSIWFWRWWSLWNGKWRGGFAIFLEEGGFYFGQLSVFHFKWSLGCWFQPWYSSLGACGCSRARGYGSGGAFFFASSAVLVEVQASLAALWWASVQGFLEVCTLFLCMVYVILKEPLLACSWSSRTFVFYVLLIMLRL